MRISISGRHIDIGEALKTHVSEQLDAIISKYAERPIEAGVTFAHDAHEYLCETTVHLSTGLHAQAKSKEVEIYAAFDSCCEKMEKQLRRHKRRLKNHHAHRAKPVESFEATSYILASPDDADEPGETGPPHPVIVAEIESRVPLLTVAEAVMQMELANAPVLVFKNQAHGKVNVVYVREDGNIGWIDPRNSG